MLKIKHELNGWIDYPEKGKITDEKVYRLIKKHSRLIDRISTRKMVEMSINGQHILMGLYKEEGWDPENNDWMFYGKNGFCTLF